MPNQALEQTRDSVLRHGEVVGCELLNFFVSRNVGRVMEFYVMARTYNVYGGHLTLSLIPGFLLMDAPDFGPAISELTLTFHFPHSGPARSTLDQLFADFHANRQSLPKVVFRRKRRQATIDIASDLLDGREWDQRRGLSLLLFTAGLAEAVSALGGLRQRISGKDDFRLEEFLNHCQDAQSRVPSSAEELDALAAECKSRRAAAYGAMSPWERLGINWQDFHPDARQVLDDPFFWESSNDFAPHGNDTGADLLADYRKWLVGKRSDDPITLLQSLIRRWGYPLDSSNDLEQPVFDEAAVALAFAEFKFRAECRPAVASLARSAIQRQCHRANEATDWPHREHRLRTLDLLEAKLLVGGG